MDIFTISTYTQVHAPLIAILIALFTRTVTAKKTRHVLVFLILSYLINVSVVHFQVYFLAGRYLGEIFDITMILLLTHLFYYNSQKNKRLLFIGMFLLLIYLVIRWTFQPNYSVPNISSFAGGLCIITYCLSFLYYLIQSEKELHFTDPISFGFTLIILLYETGGFFTSLLIQYITSNGGENASLYTIRNVISIVSYVAFAWMIWKTSTSDRNQRIQLDSN